MNGWVIALGVVMVLASLALLLRPHSRRDDDEYPDVSGWGTRR